MISEQTAVESIRHRLLQADERLIVYWLQVTTNREVYRNGILSNQCDIPIVPIVVRDGGFQNANALMSDLMTTIDVHREDFASVARPIAGDRRRIVVLLISRSALSVPQISSPAQLPDWFPVCPGETVAVRVEDLCWSAEVPINAAECRVDDICERVHRIEGVLLSRLTAVHSHDHRSANSFFDHIRDKKQAGEKYTEFLERARAANSAVANPGGYRPSARDGDSLVGRMLRLVSAASPDELSGRCRSLSEALQLKDDVAASVKDAVVAVLLRPTNRDSQPANRFTRNLLMSVYASSQFITASAHADDYPRYPVLLLRGMSYDLRVTLEALTVALEKLSTPLA